MVDFSSVQQQVKNMMGMKFGEYKSSVSNMDKVYKKGKQEGTHSHAITYSQEYIDKNGNIVATATESISANKKISVIFDERNNRIYETDWQNTNEKSSKFTRIRICDKNNDLYAIEDSNHNGFIDNDDTVTYCGQTEKGEKSSISVLDLLNGRI